MARKNVGLTYVDEFTFPKEQGFTGSAGKQPVKGYMRGGHVKSPDKTKGKGSSRAGMPKNVKGKGGKVHRYQEGGDVRAGHAEGKNPYPPDSARFRLWEKKYHEEPPPPPISISTLGTIGGAGPTATAQAQWVEIDIGGVAHWIPVWV